jgi:hypothetical protein
MATSMISFAPITLDAPFGEARASNATGLDPHHSIVSALPSIIVASTPSMREAPTQPVVTGDSWSTAEAADSDPASGVFAKNPEWCIDLGEEMIALHAVELFARLATGQIPKDAPVWRVGREAWTPAKDVPELHYAVEDGTSYEGDRPSLDMALDFARTG